MKKSIRIEFTKIGAWVLLFMLGATLFSCSYSAKKAEKAEKVEKAEETLNQAEEDLEEAEKNYQADYKKFVSETNKVIASNERIIESLNHSIKNVNAKERIKHEDNISKLDERNRALKKRIKEYKHESNHEWESFKVKFNNDLEDLGAALSSFVSKE